MSDATQSPDISPSRTWFFRKFRHLSCGWLLTAAITQADPFSDPGKSAVELKKATANQKVSVFEVSKVKSDKKELMRIFAKIGEVEADDNRKGADYQVVQRIDAKRFIVNPMTWKYSSVASSSGSVGGGGGSYSTAWQEPVPGKVFLLETEDEQNVADGEVLKGISVVESDEVFEYTTAAGAKASVRILKPEARKAEEPLTREQWIARLKAGETWVLPAFSVADCRDCFGKGKLGSLQNNATCTSCEGVGTVTTDCLVKW